MRRKFGVVESPPSITGSEIPIFLHYIFSGYSTSAAGCFAALAALVTSQTSMICSSEELHVPALVGSPQRRRPSHAAPYFPGVLESAAPVRHDQWYYRVYVVFSGTWHFD